MGRLPNKPAFCLDSQICTGCKTCIVACIDKNDLDPGVRWRRVVEYTGGEWTPMTDGTFKQNVYSYYISVSCNHCAEPICVEACPTTAMHQDDNGIVMVDQSKCIGCKYCQWACPYSAPQYEAALGLMSKCNFCVDEIKTGAPPACVAACPTRALSYGEYDEMLNTSVPQLATAPLPDENLTSPVSVFKPHKLGRPVNSTDGQIANPEEIKDA
jgi:anaerobic dimethyl sulfoxide reductase subunit B (iron-sulfur subunit)